MNAASDLFCERGFSRVSMGDIAAAVAVGPSALYRHFPGKQELLAEVLLVRTREFIAGISEAEQAEEPTVALARTALEHRDFGVLWEREARHLDDAARREVANGIHVIVDAMRGMVGAIRPGHSSDEVGFLAWATIGVLVSPSFHHVELPGDRLPMLLADIATSVMAMPTVVGGEGLTQHPQRPEATARSRREELLNAAIALFAARGFHGVGIEDIAAAAGLTGTSIYRHFDAKNELLLAAIQRGAEWLRLDLNRALARSATPEAALRLLVASYVGQVLDHPGLITVLISETANLPDVDRRRIQTEQRNYIAEWLHLLDQVHPQESAAVARVRVQAALTIANTCGRNEVLRKHAGLCDAVQEAAVAALGLDPKGSGL